MEFNDWIDVTEEASHDYLLPTHVTNVASRTTYALTEASAAVLQNALNNVKQAVLPIRSLSTDLHEHSHTVHGIKELLLSQNRNVHVLALTKLADNDNVDQDIFPEDVRAFARNNFNQKQELLFLEFSVRSILHRSDICMNGFAWL